MSSFYHTVRKIWLIAAMMLIPGCLDSTPESLDGVDISILAESFVEGDTIQFMASGNNPKGAKFLWDFGDDSGSGGVKIFVTIWLSLSVSSIIIVQIFSNCFLWNT